jgi:hypothetical protein
MGMNVERNYQGAGKWYAGNGAFVDDKASTTMAVTETIRTGRRRSK